ncbi:MAG: ATP-dependent helicase [Leptospiraceae bacterium]|nr:ATP-dependent helicase [Leptospiraceae bacterium]
MEFLISDTFSNSLGKLNNDEQKAVKTTAFDLQMNPANPGMQFHRIDKAKDPNFWSIRVNKDIRIILHKSNASLLLCYVDHHDKAYSWAEKRKLEVHPKTGAAQLVTIRETVKEITVPKYTEVKVKKELPPLFSSFSKEELLSYGVPEEWLDDVKQVNEDSIFDLIEHLPQEAGEALLELATGSKPEKLSIIEKDANPFKHPDAQRRFRVMQNSEDLAIALEYPWEKWAVYLHPTQKEIVEKEFNGPARVSGSAGTGKTIVALHRAVSLLKKNENVRVLLTTFSDPLANILKRKLRQLLHNQPKLGDRIDVESIGNVGLRFYKIHFGSYKIIKPEEEKEILNKISIEIKEAKFSLRFLYSEWKEIIDAWQIKEEDVYLQFKRLGKKTRLPEIKRKMLWQIFQRTRKAIKEKKLLTSAELFYQLSLKMEEVNNPPYHHIIVDEAQDIHPMELKFLASMVREQQDSLFFAGDLGQRIFGQPFSWKSCGVDIIGRSKNLKINYRTSHQIRNQADRLLGNEISDVDGNVEKRIGTVSLFNGPYPEIKIFDSKKEEQSYVTDWIKDTLKKGLNPEEIGIFVRTEKELERASSALEKEGLKFKILTKKVETTGGYISLSTMHLAKGLEFKNVILMACEDEVIPLADRIENAADDVELEEIYNTERHLLYVAITRARDFLLITAVSPESEFLDDLKETSI